MRWTWLRVMRWALASPFVLVGAVCMCWAVCLNDVVVFITGED